MQSNSPKAIAETERPGVRLSALERDHLLIRRKWTRAERKIVLQGFWGRFAIAIEPIVCGAVFAALTYGLYARGLWFLTPIFGSAAVAFAIYAFVMLIAPVRALLQTFGPSTSSMGMFAIESRIPTRRKGQTDTSPSSSTTNGSAMNGPATAITPPLRDDPGTRRVQRVRRDPYHRRPADRCDPQDARRSGHWERPPHQTLPRRRLAVGRRPQRDGSRLVGRPDVAVAAGPDDHPADRNDQEDADYECDSDRQRDTG